MWFLYEIADDAVKSFGNKQEELEISLFYANYIRMLKTLATMS